MPVVLGEAAEVFGVSAKELKRQSLSEKDYIGEDCPSGHWLSAALS